MSRTPQDSDKAQERCSQITDYLRSWSCSRNGVVERDGTWYCKQHDPEVVKSRRDARAEKWQAEWDAKGQAKARATAIQKAKDAVVQAARDWSSAQAGGGVAVKQERSLVNAVAALERLEGNSAD